jgi:mRNA-degrading endonuclease YafQ of YafQ-DinJ toxin-antitoxin module
MIIKYSAYFLGRIKKRLLKSPQLRVKLKKQLSLLEKDIRHPSLKVHKLKGKRAEEYALWIEGNLRITFLMYDEYYLLTDVITHDEY